MKRLTIREYAESRKARGLAGGTVQAVHKAAESGRITLADGHLDPETADFEWEKNTRKRADLHGKPPATDSQVITATPVTAPPGWSDAKAREQAARAEMAEIQLAQIKHDLIDRAGYERAAQRAYRELRDSLIDVLPPKIAPELAGLGGDSWAIECCLRNALRQTLASVTAAWTPTHD